MKKYMIALSVAFAFVANAGLNVTAPTIVKKYDIHDVNRDEKVTLDDALAIFDQIEAGAYDVKFDVNKDTKITLDDALSIFDCIETKCGVEVEE